MGQEDSLKKVDILIRALSQSKPSEIQGISAEDASSLKDDIDEDDKPKVIDLLEDLAVSLRDDPDSKRKIITQVNKLEDGYGHIKPIAEAISSVKTAFLT